MSPHQFDTAQLDRIRQFCNGPSHAKKRFRTDSPAVVDVMAFCCDESNEPTLLIALQKDGSLSGRVVQCFVLQNRSPVPLTVTCLAESAEVLFSVTGGSDVVWSETVQMEADEVKVVSCDISRLQSGAAPPKSGRKAPPRATIRLAVSAVIKSSSGGIVPTSRSDSILLDFKA